MAVKSVTKASDDRGMRHNSVSAGLRAFFKIAQKWNLTTDEAMALLGHPGRSTYYNWRDGDVGQVTRSFDLASRLSYVLGIFKALEMLYSRPELADGWVRRPNAAFGGQSAIEKMSAGHIVDIAAVREYLESFAGDW